VTEGIHFGVQETAALIVLDERGSAESAETSADRLL
jgi:hypothetical protein